MNAVISITPHHQIKFVKEEKGMQCLRDFFPDGVADYMNFVLFSTSGVHGTYLTIEEVEKSDEDKAVTFLVIQPRTVYMTYGNCVPESDDDFKFLRKLRASSKRAIAGIGQ